MGSWEHEAAFHPVNSRQLSIMGRGGSILSWEQVTAFHFGKRRPPSIMEQEAAFYYETGGSFPYWKNETAFHSGNRTQHYILGTGGNILH
jgi:hypothetical protein